MTLRATKIIGVTGMVLLAVSACDTLKEQAGLTKKAPDEFAVVTKAPLVIPPDFKLRPPRPGAKRPQEIQPDQAARGALIAGSGSPRNARTAAADNNGASGSTVSLGETALLRQAGAADASGDIRELVNQESTVLAEKSRSFTDRLLFWQKKHPDGSEVDAAKEAQRLQEATASGKPVNEGNVPVIKRRKRGWLEEIF
jgi:hypothetical protein